MESISDAQAARDALAAAEASRAGLVQDVRAPRGHYLIAAVGWAMFIALFGFFWANENELTTTQWLVVISVCCPGALLDAWDRRRFQQLNGVRVLEFGHGSREFRDRVLPLWLAIVLSYGLALFGAYHAADSNSWGLLVLVAAAGGCVRGLANRQWMRYYREELGA